MLQTVDGREVFVVEFDTMPQLPIIWNTEEEKPLAEILQHAIQNEVIKEPGKYGLAIEPPIGDTSIHYSVYTIKE